MAFLWRLVSGIFFARHLGVKGVVVSPSVPAARSIGGVDHRLFLALLVNGTMASDGPWLPYCPLSFDSATSSGCLSWGSMPWSSWHAPFGGRPRSGGLALDLNRWSEATSAGSMSTMPILLGSTSLPWKLECHGQPGSGSSAGHTILARQSLAASGWNAWHDHFHVKVPSWH